MSLCAAETRTAPPVQRTSCGTASTSGAEGGSSSCSSGKCSDTTKASTPAPLTCSEPRPAAGWGSEVSATAALPAAVLKNNHKGYYNIKVFLSRVSAEAPPPGHQATPPAPPAPPLPVATPRLFGLLLVTCLYCVCTVVVATLCCRRAGPRPTVAMETAQYVHEYEDLAADVVTEL